MNIELWRARKKELGLTYDSLAEISGVSRRTIAGLFAAEPRYRSTTTATVEAIERALGLSPDISADKYGDRPKPSTDHSRWVPVYGAIAAGVPIEAIEDIEDWEEIDIDHYSGEIIGLRVKGHSMEPRICNGDIVLIHLQPTVENGEIAAVMVNGDEATLKKVKLTENGIMLIPLNSAFDTIYFSNREIEEKPVRILGKMVELRGKF